MAAVASMVVLNFILLNLFSLSQPLVWLYPALIARLGSPVAVTNVVKHSSARICCITLETDERGTLLEVDDDGRGAVTAGSGTGLEGLADRVRAAGGALEVGPVDPRGFKLRVRLSAPAQALGISR